MRSAPPLLVVCALLQESAGVAAALTDRTRGRHGALAVERGELEGYPVTVATTGMGGPAVRQALRTLTGVLRPRHVLMLGLSGGLDPALERLRICRADTVADDSGALRPVGEGFPWPAAARGWSTVSVFSAERVLGPAEKRAAAARGFQLVDMESAAFFDECRALQLTAGAVRVVFDTPEEALPAIDTDQLGRPRLASVAGFLARRPWKIAALLELKRRLDAALERLRSALRVAVQGVREAAP